MKKDTGTLGPVIKQARKEAGLTRQEFKEIIGIADRHIAAIENDGQAPSYESLYKIVMTLGIDANAIFYPDKPAKNSRLLRMNRQLKLCDEDELSIVDATLRAVIRKKIKEM